jgi:hypothetical protein
MSRAAKWITTRIMNGMALGCMQPELRQRLWIYVMSALTSRISLCVAVIRHV